MVLQAAPSSKARASRIILWALLIALLLHHFTAAPRADTSIDDGALVEPGPVDTIVKISFKSQTELAQLASRLDVWEVHSHDGGNRGYLIGRITSEADTAWLETYGTHPETYTPLFAAPATIPDYPCYRTITDLNTQLSQWALEHPTLTELRAIGASYEGRPLLAMRLTNEQIGLEKPVLMVMANIHGRELITPEVAMDFIARLLAGYGVDADITWLLDHHRIEILVSANPDGHVRNEPEAGQPWAYWRKNVNPTHGSCSGTAFGIDLNRNSTYQWGGIGASSDPCVDVYRGPVAISELETQAIQAFLEAIFPAQRPDDDTTPAETSGLFITLHSYGDLVLWPWSYTYDAAPDAPALAILGRKLASFGGYTPQQASDLYPASGTTDDFVYGELGVAAYTFEIGSTSDGFYPLCSRYDALIEPNVEALLYAAKVARAPYSIPAGPDTSQVSAMLASELVTPTLTITAHIADTGSVPRPITEAEAYLNAPPWAGSNAYVLAAEDGAFDAATEVVRGTLTVAELKPGRHIIFVRGRNGSGAWGPLTAAFATVQPDLWPHTVALPLVRK